MLIRVILSKINFRGSFVKVEPIAIHTGENLLGIRYRGSFVRTPARLALLLLILTLCVFLAGSWFVFEVVRQSKERDLARRLIGIGQTAAVHLNGKSFSLLELADSAGQFDFALLKTLSGSPEFETLRVALKELRIRNVLRSVMIIDASGRVIIDARDKFTLGEPNPFLALDEKEIREAFSGEATTSPLYRVRHNPYKRCYVPLRTSTGEVAAVLRLEASRDYFVDLARIKNALYWLGGIVFCLLALVAMLFYKLLQSLLHTEETLAFTDRLQSLGAMAASLAHEIRNPLSIIRATAESAADELPLDAEQQSLLRDIVGETERLNHLITQFLQFAKPSLGSTSTQVCEAKKVIESVTSMLAKELERQSIKVDVNTTETLPKLHIDEKSLRQILLNLFLNAKEAIGENGTIEVRAFPRRRRAIIEVIDNGRGIPENIMLEIFDPFFTTKEDGTGLGLFVSRMLVERAGGILTLSSQKNKGTCATITMPLCK